MLIASSRTPLASGGPVATSVRRLRFGPGRPEPAPYSRPLPFAALLYLILGRVYFELIIVGFKIAEDADEIARNTRK